jgi:hypothetical protein
LKSPPVNTPASVRKRISSSVDHCSVPELGRHGPMREPASFRQTPSVRLFSVRRERRRASASMRSDNLSIAPRAAIACRPFQFVKPILDPLERDCFEARSHDAEPVADARAVLRCMVFWLAGIVTSDGAAPPTKTRPQRSSKTRISIAVTYIRPCPSDPRVSSCSSGVSSKSAVRLRHWSAISQPPMLTMPSSGRS